MYLFDVSIKDKSSNIFLAYLYFPVLFRAILYLNFNKKSLGFFSNACLKIGIDFLKLFIR